MREILVHSLVGIVINRCCRFGIFCVAAVIAARVLPGLFLREVFFMDFLHRGRWTRNVR